MQARFISLFCSITTENINFLFQEAKSIRQLLYAEATEKEKNSVSALHIGKVLPRTQFVDSSLYGCMVCNGFCNI